KIINTPPDVPGATVVHPAPPRVMPGARLEHAESIHEATLEQMREIGTLLVGEPRVAPVGARVCQVDLGVRDVQVAAEDDRLALGTQLLEVGQKRRIPFLRPVIEARQSAL